jgi:hypothetical protein
MPDMRTGFVYSFEILEISRNDFGLLSSAYFFKRSIVLDLIIIRWKIVKITTF